ncbi:334_t:CDS:2, partial [Funneliformis geosporum]
MLLLTGYNSDQPLSSEKFCDYDQYSILSDTESSHIRYFCDGIKKLSQSFIDRLSKGISEDSLILEEEDDGITDEDNDIKNYGNKSTSTLWRHVKKHHPNIYQSNEPLQIKEKFTSQGFRKKLIDWIVIDDQPFTVIEEKKFIDMLTYLKFDLNLSSADTLRRDLDANFIQIKDNVYQKLQ